VGRIPNNGRPATLGLGKREEVVLGGPSARRRPREQPFMVQFRTERINMSFEASHEERSSLWTISKIERHRLMKRWPPGLSPRHGMERDHARVDFVHRTSTSARRFILWH
jgi:hypothetical protein